MPSGLVVPSKSIRADREDIEQVGELLRKMSDLELRNPRVASQADSGPPNSGRCLNKGSGA
jgi:hypothetical protein